MAVAADSPIATNEKATSEGGFFWSIVANDFDFPRFNL